jgi:hypothetical protein
MGRLQDALAASRLTPLLNFACLSLILTGPMPLHGAGLAADVKDRDFLRAIAEGYLSNRESFAFLTCKFRVTEGKAPTLDAANRTGPTVDTQYADGVWQVKGNKVRLELKGDPDAVEAFKRNRAANPGVPQPAPPSHKFFTNGVTQLVYDAYMNRGNITSHQKWQPMINLTPYDMGIMGKNEEASPARRILQALDRDRYCHLDGKERREGAELLRITVGETRERLEMTYLLHPEKGYLPLECQVYGPDGDCALRLYVTETANCSNGRWFPMRSVAVREPDRASGPFYVREIKVLTLDVDNVPPDDSFSVGLPKGAGILDLDAGAAPLVLQQDERIGLTGLDTLLERVDAQAKLTPETSLLTAEARAPITLPFVLASLLAVVAVVVLATRLGRRHWKQGAAP